MTTEYVVVPRAALERAAGMVESYSACVAAYVKADDIERWDYVPGIDDFAEDLRAMLAAAPPHPAAVSGRAGVLTDATDAFLAANPDIAGELRAWRRDAERYRVLRNPPGHGDAYCVWNTTHDGDLSRRGEREGPLTGSSLDAAIDAARTEGKGNG